MAPVALSAFSATSMVMWAAMETEGGLLVLATLVAQIILAYQNQKNVNRMKQDDERREREAEEREREHQQLLAARRENEAIREHHANQNRVLRAYKSRADQAEAEFVELCDAIVGQHVLPGGNPRGDD